MNKIIQTNHLLTFPVELPVPGSVNVHLGQSVTAGGVIAFATLPAKFQVFDVVNQFRVREARLDTYIKRLAGEEVQRGDVIAKKSGLISRFFRAPEDGKVVSVRDGRVTLAMGESTIEAISPISGIVGELIPGMGAVVVARGLSMRGSWGNGKVAIGKLVLMDDLGADTLASASRAIVFLDGMVTMREVEKVAKAGAAGVLVTSLDPLFKSDYAIFETPVMSLLGFGEARMDRQSRSVLDSMHGNEVFLVARSVNANDDSKPELFQPSAETQASALFAEADPALIGQPVRLLGQPYFGSVGEIAQISTKTERLASGMESRVVVVKREDGTEIRMPLANLEML